MSFDLVKMRRVNLKSLIKEQDFIPWLLESANLDVLQETVGFKMNVQMLNDGKDPSFPDVMVKKLDAPNMGSWVLLESQYDLTDDDFMARLFRYASLMKPSNVIWIAERFSNSHKNILDWLNVFGAEQIHFFGMEIELWGMGKDIACKFNIVSRPQQWIAPKLETAIKTTRKYNTSKRGKPRQERNEQGLTVMNALYLKFWDSLKAYLKNKGGIFQINATIPKNYSSISVGKTGISLKIQVSSKKKNLAVEMNFWSKDSQPYFYIMKLEENQIHDELGYALEWKNIETLTGSSISISKEDVNLWDEDVWGTHFDWIDEKVQDFLKIMRPRLRAINPDDWLNKIER